MRHEGISRWVVAGLMLLLAGCAGTVQRDTGSGARRIEQATYTGVDVVMTDAARRLQGDNPQFSVRELGDFMRRRLESTDLLSSTGTHRVEVSIESFRVRHAAAAVILGIMAGTDSIEGYVRVFDTKGKQVHGYKVSASYGLGGWAGGMDGTRMSWLYDKFSELAVAELGGTTDRSALVKGGSAGSTASAPRTAQPSVAIAPPMGGRAAAGTQILPKDSMPAEPVAVSAPMVTRAATPARTPEPSPVPMQHVHQVPAPSGFADIGNVDAVPLKPEHKERYARYLTLSPPKAFAVYETGGWRMSAKNGHSMSRVLDACAREGRKCWLYAVDGEVVWREKVSERTGRTDQLKAITAPAASP